MAAMHYLPGLCWNPDVCHWRAASADSTFHVNLCTGPSLTAFSPDLATKFPKEAIYRIAKSLHTAAPYETTNGDSDSEHVTTKGLMTAETRFGPAMNRICLRAYQIIA